MFSQSLVCDCDKCLASLYCLVIHLHPSPNLLAEIGMFLGKVQVLNECLPSDVVLVLCKLSKQLAYMEDDFEATTGINYTLQL